MKKWKIKGGEKFKKLLSKLEDDDLVYSSWSGDSEDGFYFIDLDVNRVRRDDSETLSSEYEEVTIEELTELYYPTSTIEKWSVGSYIVITNQTAGILLPTGTVRKIKDFNGSCVTVDGDYLAISREKDNTIKWFITKQEAENFAKTLTKTTDMEDFKIGDWVYADKSATDDYRDAKYIPVFQIKEFNPFPCEYLRPVKGESTGVHKRYCRKALPHEIPDFKVFNEEIIEETKEQKLIKEAYKRYPIGTKFIPAHILNDLNSFCIISDDSFFIFEGSAITSVINSFSFFDNTNNPKYGNTTYNRVVFDDGKWAEIVEETVKPLSIQEIQEECKRKFPIGCEFRSPTTKLVYTLHDTISTYDITDSSSIDGGLNQSYLYYNGDYAELISLPEDKSFKSDILNGPPKSKYLIAAEKALKHFKDAKFYIGCKYEDTDRNVQVSDDNLTICESDSEFCYIECGRGLLWEYKNEVGEEVYGKLLIEDKPEFMEREFQVGDRVECIKDYEGISCGMQGTITDVISAVSIGVSWDNFTNGHNCNETCENNYSGYYVHKKNIKLISSNSISTSKELNTYGLRVGDTLNAEIISAWSTIDCNEIRYNEPAWRKALTSFEGNRTIKSFKVIHGCVAFEVSDTCFYLKAKGFKEFADNYYKQYPIIHPQDAYDIIMHQREQLIQEQHNQTQELLTLPTNKIYVRKSKSIK